MLFMVCHREPVLDMINCKPSLSPNNLIFITFLNVFSGRSIGLPVTPRDVKWLFKFIFFLLFGQFSGCLRARLRILREQQFASISQKDSAVMADGQITYTQTAKMDEKVQQPAFQKLANFIRQIHGLLQLFVDCYGYHSLEMFFNNKIMKQTT